MTLRLCLTWLFVLGLSAGPARGAESTNEPLLIFAAASMTDSLQKVSDAYTRSSGVSVKLSFAASSALAKQIESGARVDVFLSADQEWMDYLASRGLIDTGSRSDLLGNRLVLIAPRESTVSMKLTPSAPIADALGKRGRLAVGDPDSVPAGRYAKAALAALGLWNSLEPRLARAENVRVALSYVARGEAPLGIVYATDAPVEPKVRVIDVFPENTHPPIAYPVALTKTAHGRAADYLKFLRSDAGTRIFTAAGFTTLPAGNAMTKDCSGFAFDVSGELEILGGQSAGLPAAGTINDAPSATAGKAYRVTLLDQAKTKFVMPPEKITVADGSYAGLLGLAPTKSTLRITLSEAAWIDVLADGKALASTRHTGSHQCPGLRKSVEFKVTPGAPLTLQLSGSTTANLLLAVTEY